MRLIRKKVSIAVTACLFSSIDSTNATVVNSMAPPSIIYELPVLKRDLPTLLKAKFLSSTDIVASADGMLLFIAQQTEKRVDIIDAAINPFLVGAWRTAPYGHLGGYITLVEIITQPGHTNVTTELTIEEINDLVEYVHLL